MNTISLAEEYFQLYSKHQEQYRKVALLYQVGSFYEFYANMEGTNTNAKTIASELNFRYTFKYDKKYNKVIMAGIPTCVIENHLPILVKKGYTVVLYDQQNDGQASDSESTTSERKVRTLSRIISSSTDLNSIETNNWLVVVFVQFYDSNASRTKKTKPALSIGFAIIDRTISERVIVHEVHESSNDRSISMDTLVYMLQQYPPTECVIVSANVSKALTCVEKALPHAQVMLHSIQYDPTQMPTFEGTVTEEYLTSLLPHQLVACSYLLQFLQEHFLTLKRPEIQVYRNDRILELTSTAIEQLDLPLLIRTIDNTKTLMGRRLLTQRMYQPYQCSKKIEESLALIDSMTFENAEALQKILQNIPDLQRLHQRLAIASLKLTSLISCKDAYKSIINHVKPVVERWMTEDQWSNLKHMIEFIEKTLNVNAQDETNYSWFSHGYNDYLDEVVSKFREVTDKITNLKSEMENIIGKPDCLKLNIAQNGFETTNNRSLIVKKHLSHQMEYVKNKSNVIITSNDLRRCIWEQQNLKMKLESLQKDLFETFQHNLNENYKSVLKSIEDLVANVDIAACNRIWHVKNRYSRPKVLHTQHNELQIKQLRHPIIEKLHTQQQYIPNDVHLSAEGHVGYVMYGMNAGGKTSILKSVGIAVILAQAGMYVPAQEMKFTPLRRIITRIAGGDNIVRAQSSFEVEMHEIRTVLQRADRHTLLLGDEVCRGTEVESANAIVYALLDHLHQHNVLTMTATHLHELSKVVQKEMPKFRVCHTAVEICPNGDIVYHRKLVDGSGPERYGLEVARALDFPKAFIEKALVYRQHNDKNKKSSYNKRKMVRFCEVCKYKPQNSTDIPLDTHHLVYQCQADEKGYHDHDHKHALHNLVVLCKPCHKKVHDGQLVLVRKQTPKGNKLIAQP